MVTFGGNAEISGNTATAQAGGLYVSGIEVEITDSFTLSGNTAKYGGGLRVMPEDLCPTSVALKDNVTVTDNTAELGGGVCLSGDVSLTTTDSVALDGYTGDLGGGLFLLGSVATVGGSTTIDSNSASLVGGSTSNNAAGGIYLTRSTDNSSGSPVYTPSYLDLEDSVSVSNNTAVNEVGGIIIDKGGNLSVSDTVSILGNEMVGDASGICVYPDGALSVWGTPQIGATDTDNGIYLTTGTYANIPAGEDLLSGARVNFDYVDPEAAGSLVAKRADGSAAASDESALMHYTPGGFSVAKDASDASRYVLEERAPSTVLSIARLYGDERYLTAGQVAGYGRDISTEQTLIVASGHNRNFPDALAASSLSGASGNAPILLTDPWYVPAATRALLEQAASATKVYIIGGTPSVSSNVESEIAQILPGAQIERIGGESRMETAELVYAEIAGQASRTAIIARSMDFPDSLSASSWAAYTASPIFLTDFSEQRLTQGTLDALSSGGFERILVLGSELSVPASVAAAARDAAGLADADVVRLAGGDRVGTSLAMASWAADPQRDASERLSWDNLAVTRADSHTDALAGGALQGMHGSVVLLTWTNEAHPGVLAAIAAAQDGVSEIRFFGDENSVAVSTMRAYARAIQFDEPAWKPDESVAFDLG